ncbi:MAG: AAA family ATPase [bacterium]|nr:AAA family ATPase [bacterium]
MNEAADRSPRDPLARRIPWQWIQERSIIQRNEFVRSQLHWDPAWTNRLPQRLVWQLSHSLRWREQTALTRYCHFLFCLFRDQQPLAAGEINAIDLLAEFEDAYHGIKQYPHGAEIFNSYSAIVTLLKASTLQQLGETQSHLAVFDSLPQPLLRLAVIDSLRAFADVSRQVEIYHQVTNLNQQATVLNLAASRLQKLGAFIQEQVSPPEQALLIRVHHQWQEIITTAQGEWAKSSLRQMARSEKQQVAATVTADTVLKQAMPFDNPYIVGDPVYPPLFKGRRDIFNAISKVWAAKTNPDSIIVYGHRRMGKSSILRNLAQEAPTNSLVVYADMAGETSFVDSTATLLLNLADRLHETLSRTFPDAQLPPPDEAAYSSAARAQTQFSRLTNQARDLLGSGTLILALDEFEAIERAVEEGKIGKEIFQFLRTKTQEPWLTLVFGGLHTLDEMSRDYEQPFYGSYTNIPVSYLTHQDAWDLITNPTPDFTLNYEHEAVEQIITLTGGQPYLVQLVCRDALDHLNYELFDQNKTRDTRILLSDVEAVVAGDFFRHGTVYFDGVWHQTTEDGQRTMLKTLAQQDSSWLLDELAAACSLSQDALLRHLRWAERHDVLRKLDGDVPRWEFYVPLMRQWIRERR